MNRPHDEQPSLIENILAFIGFLLVAGSIVYLFATYDEAPTARGWGDHEPGYFATGSTMKD